MSRRAPIKSLAPIQPAPLLAVLLCAMGAMVALAVAFARQGQCLAAQAQRANSMLTDSDSQDLDWRIGQLQQARDKTEAQLRDRRLELSHIDDHERRLKEDLDRLRTSVGEMQHITASATDQRQQTAAELERVRGSIARMEVEVGEARHDSKNKGVCYSVVPYQGPNQTRRRPIYIECAADSVILQPEEIVLKESDFDGPLGPGNPLAAALRAVREQIASRQNGAAPEEVYPLLLVRPEGIGAYYAARSALISWGSEFGYELVGADWKLQFPESDPQLRQLMRTVVTEARMRQLELVIAAPRQYAKADRPKYRASAHGGFVRDGGGGSDDEPSGAFAVGKRAEGSTASRSADGGSSSGGDGSAGPHVGGNAPSNPYSGLGSLLGSGSAPTGSGAGPAGTGMRSGNAGNGQGGPGAGGTQIAQGGPGFGAQARDGLGQSGAVATDAGGYGPKGASSGGGDAGFEPFASPGSTSGGSRQLAGDNAQTGASSGQPGGTQPGSHGTKSGAPTYGGDQLQTGPYTASQSGGGGVQGGSPASGAALSQGGPGSSTASSGTDSGGGGSSASDPSAQPGGMPSASVTINANKEKPESLAKKRGRDWGLPDGANRRVGVTRPVFVVWAPDRMIILPEQGSSSGGKEIPFGPRMQDSIDVFVDGVGQHMKTWGIAGKGLYWRPTLVVDVRPGAEQRYAEFKALMSDSGLDVKERQAPAAVAGKPPAAARR